MTESKPYDLAVVVPSYNVSRTLEEQLSALARQEWEGSWEIVIVDNGSTDATAAIAERFARDLDHFRVVGRTSGQSVAYARNAGVEATDARSILFCDGDDIVECGWVKAMGDALARHDLVTGGVQVAGINPEWLAASRPGNTTDGLPHFGDVPFVRGNNCGMTRQLWESVGGFDEEFRGLEDIEFSIRAMGHGVTPVFVPSAVVAYRFRPELIEIWKQAFFYGRGRAELRRRAHHAGFRGASRASGLKSWVWLVLRLPTLVSRGGRTAWIWVLGSRIGAIRGSIEGRKL